MDERRLWVRTGCAALLIWLAAAGSARADPPSTEFWPEIHTWLRLSPAWRLSVFVPLAENLDTHYREGNLILQADYAWAETNRKRPLVNEGALRPQRDSARVLRPEPSPVAAPAGAMP